MSDICKEQLEFFIHEQLTVQSQITLTIYFSFSFLTELHVKINAKLIKKSDCLSNLWSIQSNFETVQASER